jgi:WD40 repeat protein/Flp pilus assembly protein TadD
MADEKRAFESLDELFGKIEPTDDRVPSHRAPFKFLDPYGPEDGDIFYGREFETAELYAKFYKNRLVVVYGESGTGKTSLIQCGLRNEIPQEDALFLNVRSAIDPLESLRNELLKQIRAAVDIRSTNVRELLKEVIDRKSKTLVLVFDQFEEFFLFQPKSIRQAFIKELAGWINQDLNVRIIIGIREEYLAHLTELEAKLPDLYQNRLWVRRMSHDQAKQVITSSCQACGVGIEPDLVDALVDELAKGGEGVELPILQVVLDALYNQAVQADPEKPVLTLAAYQSMGKARSILARFVEDKVSAYESTESMRQVLKALVTSEGTRQVSSFEEIEERVVQFGEAIPKENLHQILNQLINDRLIREDADNHLYELRHDALASTIRQWMTGLEQELMEVRQVLENRFKEYQQRSTLLDKDTLAYIAPYESKLRLKGEIATLVDKSKKEAVRKKRRVLAFGLATVTIILIVVSGLGIWSYLNYREAERQKEIAERKTLEAEKQFLQANHNLGLAFNEIAENRWFEKNYNAAHLYSLYALAQMKPEKATEKQAAARGRILSHSGYPVIFSTPAIRHHEDAVRDVSFSPDGKQVASGSYDNAVRLWDVATGKTTATLEGHTDRLFSVSFSPDGKQLASGSADNTVRLWDVAMGKELATLEGHKDRVYSVSFSPNGKQLASGSKDNTIRLWDVATGKLLATLQGHTGRVFSVSFSPDGKQLASGSADTTVRIWDVATGKTTATLQGHTNWVWSVSFSPNGKQLASGSADNTMRIWDVATGKTTATLQGHTNWVSSVSFSPDGKQLASGAADNTVRIWDVVTGKTTVTLQGHTNWVLSISFSPDGKQLASGAADNTMRIWDVATGKTTATLQGHTNWVLSVSFSPDGKQLASGSADTTVHIWDVATGKTTATLQGHTNWVWSVSFSPDGKQLASGSADNTVRLWDVATGKTTATLQGHTNEVLSISFSSDGKQLASGSADNTVRLWDVATGKTTATLQGHTNWVLSISFSPDGKQLASGSADNTVRLWDVATGKSTATLQGHTSWVWSVSFSPDGKQLASGSVDNTVRLWDVATGKTTATLQGHTNKVFSVSFSPDGKQLASGSFDNTVRLWDVERLQDLLAGDIETAIQRAEAKYQLHLHELNLETVLPERNFYGMIQKPVWPSTQPFHWLPDAEKGDGNAMLQLGIIYDRWDDIEKARYWYQKAVEAGNDKGRVRLTLLNSRLTNQQVTSLWQQVTENRNAGRYQQAIELLSEILTLDENNVHAYMVRGQLYAQQKQYDRAIADYTRVTELSPKFANAYWFRSQLYAQQEQYNRAIADCKRFTELSPEFADVYGCLGWYLILQGRFSEALQPAQKAHELDPENYNWAVNLGHIYLLQGDQQTARQYYEKTLPLIPDENESQRGLVADFELFIKRGWQVEASQEELSWMKEAFEKREDSKALNSK